MATVYVETWGNDTTGDGSAANPYLTIQKGIDEAGAEGTTIVGPGTYDTAVLTSTQTGSLGSPTTVQSRIKWAAVISGGITGIDVRTGCDYAVIDGFRITGGSYAGVAFANADVYICRNCWIHDVAQFGILATSTCTSGTIQYNRVENVGTATTHHCIYPSHPSAVVDGNVCTGAYGYGIHVYNSGGLENATVTNNISYNNGTATTGGAMLINGIGASACGCVVVNNTLVAKASSLAVLHIWDSNGIVVANNIILAGTGQVTLERLGVENMVWEHNLCYPLSETNMNTHGAYDPTTELVTNGGFETATGNDFDSWTENVSGAATIVDGGVAAYAGSKCVQFNKETSTTCNITQACLEVGKTYEVTFMAKASESGEVQIYAPTIRFTVDTDYELCRAVFTATSATLRIEPANNKSYVVYLDQVSVKRAYGPELYSPTNNMFWPKYGSRCIDTGDNTYKQAVDFWGDTPPTTVQVGAVPYNQQIHPRTFLHDPFSKPHLKTRWHHWRTRHQRLL